MADLFDASRLPDHDAYWDALAERVAANAARKSKAGGFEWLAHSRTSWVAASVLLIAALGFLVLPTENLPARKSSSEWEQALAPTDDVGKAIVWQDAPPAIGALLLGGAGGG